MYIYLEETNIICVLFKASTANVHSVFSDDTVVVSAYTAKLIKQN